MTTPASLGYRMPAEWEPHRATWLTWPHNLNSWPDAFDPIPAVWVELVAALHRHEQVHILVNDAESRQTAAEAIHARGISLGNVFFHRIPSNDAWMRDHGPTFVVRKNGSANELAAVDWRYNAWGGKYPPWDLDEQIAGKMSEMLGVPRFEPGIILEGGSIEVNGKGLLLTSESCLLNPNRNPHLSREAIETFLRDYLGVTKVLWLGDGIVGDDTDGHIDDLARFVDETTVVTVVEDDPADANYGVLQENLVRLRSMTDQEGRPLRIETLPMPAAVEREGHRMPASYANFYIANGAVLVPVFGDPNDEPALAKLRELFPGREIAPIYARDMVWGLGACHCVTQQQPL